MAAGRYGSHEQFLHTAPNSDNTVRIDGPPPVRP